MIVDFHTHIWPDSIAPRAMTVLRENCKNLYKPVADGTVASLLGRMDEWNIDISVVQPVVTNSRQVQKTNEFAASICSERIVSFGGIWPHDGNYKEQIDCIVSLGLKGIKFHVEYQDFSIDSPEMLRVYDYALSRGLIILHHAGFDPGFKPPFRSSPKQFAHIVNEMRGGIIIAAHLGGHAQWDAVERYLAGTAIYLDTSMGFSWYSKEQFLRIVQIHGADKILFASDSPWSNAADEIAAVKELPLDAVQQAAILGGNAERLLFGKIS